VSAADPGVLRWVEIDVDALARNAEVIATLVQIGRASCRERVSMFV
jgi:hypothetical protein